ncbi:MAG: HAD family phosphatase [Saprospiraceae bacterium]
MLKTIVFDLGGVFIDWNPTYVYRDIFRTDDAVDYFLKNICTSDWNEEQDAGRSLKEGTSLLVNRFPEYTTEISEFYGSWRKMLGKEDKEMVYFLKWLKEHTTIQVVALTNWSAETFSIALETFSFLSDFDGILVSGEEKIAKPNPEIYQMLINKYHIDPKYAIFIDDNRRNIDAAIQVGLPAYAHLNAYDSIAYLKKLISEN